MYPRFFATQSTTPTCEPSYIELAQATDHSHSNRYNIDPGQVDANAMPTGRLVGTARYRSSYALRSWRALGFGVLMMVMMSSGAFGDKGASAPGDVLGVDISSGNIHEEPGQTDEETKECWVFHHMVKAGGTTIKGMLHSWRRQYRGRIHFEDYAAAKWYEGAKTAELIGRGRGHGSFLLLGGYVEALRPYADRCKWFTIFRHPISRVVSAYYYCQINPRDPLCATVVVSAKTIDLHTFAEHWSNFGLRQFALAFVPHETLLSSDMAKRCPSCPGWYLLKNHFERTAQYTQHPEDLDGEMADLVKPVCERLQNDYAAVGLLENFNATLHLFNRALDLPEIDWPQLYSLVGTKNTRERFETIKREEHQALSTAWGDRKLHKLLELDMILYGFASGVHEMQLAQHGLKPPGRL